MGELVELDVTTVEESVTVNVTEEGQVDIAVFAETGPAGPAGPNSVTSATTSDGTAELLVSNIISGEGVGSQARITGVNQNENSIIGGYFESYVAEAVLGISRDSVGVVGTSENYVGVRASSQQGDYSAQFENDFTPQSAIERVRGWFVWFYNTFTGRLQTENITANRDWTLPNKSGTILLDSDLGANVATFLATPTSANLAAAVTGETGTGALVFANSPTFSGTPLIGTKIILSENGFQRAFLSSDYTIATTNTGNKIPSFSISVESGKTYKLEIMLKVTGVTGSTHNSTLVGSFNLTAANSSMMYRRAGFETESFVLASTPFSGFGLFNSTGTSSQICFLDGIIKPTSSGVLEVVLYSSSATNSVTMLKGAYMEATLLD